MVEERESKGSAYADPSRSCDIVMKGGITSGVVYPRAVCELATTFRFRNVGGTSAGAIAAAATAAAELGRACEGFERLDRLPEWIGRKGNLPSLFQPQRWTRGLFKIVLAKLEHGIWWAIGLAVLRNLPVALLGALPAVALRLQAGSSASFWSSVAWWLVACGLAILGAGFALLAFLAIKVVWAIPGNGYGLCSGWTRAFEQEESGPMPLTPWLYRKLNELAFLPDEEPLTFGHLWSGPGKAPAATPPPPEERHLELAMMTTNLTNRRAHRLPLDGDGWYFRPSQFRQLFPQEVVDWMVSKPPRKPPPADVCLDDDLVPLPDPQDMPVIVATRMSLSFPILLSAVPLWRVDESLKRAELKPEPCWFSDGGISSNFPIHFFDGLVPRRPTFAINLRPFRRGVEKSTNQRDNTWMVRCEQEWLPDWWYPFSKRRWRPYKDRRLFEFLSGIGKTMQNRVDERQMRVPGFRDRVAHVSLSETEGGMNLAMEEEVIEELTERGRHAAERLRRAYTRPPSSGKVSWDSHRWTRLRSSLAVLEEMHGRFVLGYESEAEQLGGPTYAELMELADGELPDDFPWERPADRALGGDQIGAIRAASKAKADRGATVEGGAPDPLPEGRIAPRD
jgi:predicted acylesterase/phospholipase RssA